MCLRSSNPNSTTKHTGGTPVLLSQNPKASCFWYYSPERNPDEYLNGDLKSELGCKAPAMDQNHLEKNLIGSMRRLSKSPQRVASYFNHPAVAYAKAA